VKEDGGPVTYWHNTDFPQVFLAVCLPVAPGIRMPIQSPDEGNNWVTEIGIVPRFGSRLWRESYPRLSLDLAVYNAPAGNLISEQGLSVCLISVGRLDDMSL